MNRRLLLAVAVTGAALVASVPVASADLVTTAQSGPFAYPGGVIRFEAVNGVPRVALYDSPTSSTPVKAIAVTVDRKCAITNLPQVAELLDISLAGTRSATVYLVDNGLGTTSGAAGCSSGNGRLAAGQQLVVRPGSGIEGDFLSATVNIEGKHDADLGWTARSGGAVVATGTDGLSGRADVGPDSGAGDNSVVRIDPSLTAGPVTFDSLALTESSGALNATISLDDGGDAGDAVASQFFLGETQQYAVNCTDQNTVATSGADDLGALTFERLPNGYNPAKDPACYKIGATLQVLQDALTENGQPRDVAYLDHTTTAADGTPQEVRGRLTIQWRVDRYNPDGSLRSTADLEAELARQVIYGSDDSVRSDLQWCGHDVVPAPGYAAEPQHPAGQAWCLLSDERHLEGDDIVQTQVLHGEGDPKFI